MTNLAIKEKEYFIGYTSKDENWATWIAETLENNGHPTIIQAWDFKAGGSFVEDMHNALNKCEKILLIISEDYINSDFCKSEWQNFFIDDPIGKNGLIIPVRIEGIKPDRLLKSRTYIDLSDLDEEAATRKLLQQTSTEPKEWQNLHSMRIFQNFEVLRLFRQIEVMVYKYFCVV